MGLIINPYSVAPSTETRMVMKWTLTDPADLVVKLWGQDGGTFSYDVDWGDSNSDTGVTTNDQTHTYASTGTYEVKIDGQFAGLKMGRGGADQAKLVEFSNWGTTEINGLKQMFNGCSNMVYTATDAPDITSLTATDGTSMRETFKNTATVNLDLSNWTNTGNISGYLGLYHTFHTMPNLLTLNLTGWDTSNITSGNPFVACGDATTGCIFTLPDLDFSSHTSFNDFFNAAKINTIDVSGWTLRAAGVNCTNLFYNVDAASGETFALDLSSWTNTSGITNMYSAFRACSTMTSLNLTGWDTSGVTSWALGFYQCYELTEIIGLNGLSAAALTGSACSSTFNGCNKLDFGTHNFGTSWGPNLGNVTSFSSMFANVGSTTPGSAPPNVSDWDMSGATTVTQMFKSCKHNSGSLDVSSWDVTALTGDTALQDFLYASSTSILDVSSWELSGGISGNSMYQFARQNTNLTDLDFAHANNDFSALTTWGLFNYGGVINSLTFNANADFSATTSMSGLLNQAIPTAEYDALLLRLDATNSNAVVASFNASKYTGGGAVAAARASLVVKGWTITDGGIA